jgi:type II secretory pathway predicted ATPase ExeA
MYEKFYGLRERPFELGSNLRFLYLPETHREALSNLEYGIASRKGVTVLTGEVGTGKTTLIRAALAQADAASVCVHVTNPRLTRHEFFEFLAQGFKLGPEASATKVACLAALEERLIARLDRGEYSTLIVDEVQSVSDELLEEIRLLTNMEVAGGARLLSVILVGQPEFGERLNTAELRHLKQRVALRCELRPLTLHETAGFIASRIRVAGGSAAGVFTREAVQLIYEVSGGIPRVISVLCDNALVNGFAANERPVGSRLVQDVCRDFHIQCRDDIPDDSVTPAPAPPSVVAQPAASAPAAASSLHAVLPSPAPLSPAASKPAAHAATNPLFASVGRRRRFGIF